MSATAVSTRQSHTECSTPLQHLGHRPLRNPGNGPVFRNRWAEFVAGGAGGMTAALVTSPLDVVRTRLQSDFYRQRLTPTQTLRQSTSSSSLPLLRSAAHHFLETFHILFSIYRIEGWRTLFKGLGPNLAGVIPSSAIKFYTYSNSKRIISQNISGGQETASVHLLAAATAGIATATATNPIWLVKTRLQLDKSLTEQGGQKTGRRYKNGIDCLIQVVRQEGIRGLYRGLSASYLGVT